jgi:hypothetical protein
MLIGSSRRSSQDDAFGCGVDVVQEGGGGSLRCCRIQPKAKLNDQAQKAR